MPPLPVPCPPFVFFAAFLLMVLRADAQTPVTMQEIREFDVFIKDKPAGKSRQTLVKSPDGATTLRTDADVRYRVLVYVYEYTFRGAERWENDRLSAVESHAIDGGDKFDLSAHVDAHGSVVRANSASPRLAPLVDMTTNYWRLPTKLRNGPISLLDADRGKVYKAQLRYIGPDKANVGGAQVDCSQYRIEGEIAAELWFDAHDRLVRQRTVEDGYPTELRLARIVNDSTSDLRR